MNVTQEKAGNTGSIYCLGDLFRNYSGPKNPFHDVILEVLGDLVDNMECSGCCFDENNPRIVSALLGGTSARSMEAAVRIQHYAHNLKDLGISVVVSVEEVEFADDVPEEFNMFDTDEYLIGVYEQTKCVKVYLFQR